LELEGRNHAKQEEIQIRINPGSIERAKEKLRFITSRSNAWSMKFCYLKLQQLIIV
jgi:hypothetical protein